MAELDLIDKDFIRVLSKRVYFAIWDLVTENCEGCILRRPTRMQHMCEMICFKIHMEEFFDRVLDNMSSKMIPIKDIFKNEYYRQLLKDKITLDNHTAE